MTRITHWRKPYKTNPSGLQSQAPLDDNYIQKIRRENINFDSRLLEMNINYGE